MPVPVKHLCVLVTYISNTAVPSSCKSRKLRSCLICQLKENFLGKLAEYLCSRSSLASNLFLHFKLCKTSFACQAFCTSTKSSIPQCSSLFVAHRDLRIVFSEIFLFRTPVPIWGSNRFCCMSKSTHCFRGFDRSLHVSNLPPQINTLPTSHIPMSPLLLNRFSCPDFWL